jgi:hypothetical protein
VETIYVGQRVTNVKNNLTYTTWTDYPEIVYLSDYWGDVNDIPFVTITHDGSGGFVDEPGDYLPIDVNNSAEILSIGPLVYGAPYN